MGKSPVILPLAELTAEAHEVDELADIIARESGSMGLPFFSFCLLENQRNSDSRLSTAISVRYPSTARSFERRYPEIDAVIAQARFRRHPFEWDELRGLSTEQHALSEEKNKAGMGFGISVPIHGVAGETWVASFSGESARIGVRPLKLAVSMLAMQFYVGWLDLCETGARYRSPVQLTRRESDCLAWCAEGKSSWVIGEILGVSPNTVDFHMKQAMRKLDASTRRLAVVKAIRMGLLRTDHLTHPGRGDSGPV